MNFTFRPYTVKDREAFGHVRAMTYRGGTAVGPDEVLLLDDCAVTVAEADGRVVGSATRLDMTATHGRTALRCAGFAGVGVLPEFRRFGVGSKLMDAAHLQARDDDYDVAALYPFRAPFYRKSGYEFCAARHEISCPVERLPKVRSGLPVRQIVPAQFGEIWPCYEAFAWKYGGMNLRGEKQWWRQLGGNTPFTIYAAGDPIEAYCAVRLDGEFWIEQQVRELCWTTVEGYKAVLSLFGSLGMNKTSVQWSEPLDGPFATLYQDYGAKIELGQFAMFRALRPEKLLESLTADVEGEVSVLIKDKVFGDSGPWHLCFGPEGAAVVPCDRADIEMDVGAFTQAAFGFLPFETLLEAGRAVVNRPGALAAARQLFCRRRTYCADLY